MSENVALAASAGTTRLTIGAAPVFSIPAEPKARSHTTIPLERTAARRNVDAVINRRRFMLASSKGFFQARLHSQARDAVSDQRVDTQWRNPPEKRLFERVLPGCNALPRVQKRLSRQRSERAVTDITCSRESRADLPILPSFFPQVARAACSLGSCCPTQTRHPTKENREAHMKWQAIAVASVLALATQASAADKKYGPGASDTEIKLGQTSPFSGPASAYSVIAKTQAAYFKMINDKGGVGGRKINLITLDDAYSPPKTVEQTRKLVEQEEVAVILNPLGTPTGLAVRKYLNDKKVPQLFVGAGATLWGDHERFPWSIGFQPSYQAETAVYAKYVLKNKPDAKIALFYQNDDAGKDYGNGFKKGLGPENTAKMVVAEATYESTDPTIDSQIVKLKLSGANVLFMHAIPKQAAQAIRKVGEIGWKPDMFFLAATSTSVSSVLKPAGFDYSKGIISSYSFKDPNDPQWKDDKDVQAWHDFMKNYFPDGNRQDQLIVYGYVVAEATVQVLKQCGDDLTHENIMKQAANLDVTLPLMLPGIKLKTSPTDYFPIEAMRLQRFNGEIWELFGDTIGND